MAAIDYETILTAVKDLLASDDATFVAVYPDLRVVEYKTTLPDIEGMPAVEIQLARRAMESTIQRLAASTEVHANLEVLAFCYAHSLEDPMIAANQMMDLTGMVMMSLHANEDLGDVQIKKSLLEEGEFDLIGPGEDDDNPGGFLAISAIRVKAEVVASV